MIDVVFLETPADYHTGLQGLKPIPARTLFLFPRISAGQTFHSQGVLEPFEIFFLNRHGRIMSSWTVEPPDGVIETPPGTTMVVEGREGTHYEFGYDGIERAVMEALRRAKS